MPADIDFLVTGSSPIGFSSNYVRFGNVAHGYGTSSDVINAPVPKSALASGFRTDLGSCSSSGSSSSSCEGNGSSTHFTFHGRCGSPTLQPVPSPPKFNLAKSLNELRLNPTDRQMPVAVPRRPCLVARCDDVLDLPSPNKNKKRVVFADDRGFPLALVRTLSEPSNVPPRWSLRFLAQVTQRLKTEAKSESWEVAFSQPASDYLDFRRRLDANGVSLENVIVKENEKLLVGTVKVRNIAFHKEVFIRTTSDDWKTQEDSFCTYVSQVSSPSLGVTVLHDTFSFRLPLPPESRKLEFCVCYRCSGVEYWDNNSRKNYSVVRKEAPAQIKRCPLASQSRNKDLVPERKIDLSRRFGDDVKADARLDSWSEFASRSHLYNDTPY